MNFLSAGRTGRARPDGGRSNHAAACKPIGCMRLPKAKAPEAHSGTEDVLQYSLAKVVTHGG